MLLISLSWLSVVEFYRIVSAFIEFYSPDLGILEHLGHNERNSVDCVTSKDLILLYLVVLLSLKM